jgi:hypothetical protein
MKMLHHSLLGVQTGRERGQNPLEVMGLLIGKIDREALVILDACPLPVEGSETKVIADEAITYMTRLMDSMELVSQRIDSLSIYVYLCFSIFLSLSLFSFLSLSLFLFIYLYILFNWLVI